MEPMPTHSPPVGASGVTCSLNTTSIKPLVFGGIDGLTTTLALIWSSIAAGEGVVTSAAVMIVGVANLLATATSMGIGDYMGTLAEYEATMSARGEDEAKLEANGGAAKRIVRLAAVRSGLTMFFAFVVFGGLPLVALHPNFGDIAIRRTVATILCVASFLALGVVRARLSGAAGSAATLQMSLKMLGMGSAAAFVSFASSKVIAWMILGTSDLPTA